MGNDIEMSERLCYAMFFITSNTLVQKEAHLHINQN